MHAIFLNLRRLYAGFLNGITVLNYITNNPKQAICNLSQFLF